MDAIGIRRFARHLRLGVLAAFVVLLALIASARFGARLAGLPVLIQSRAGNESSLFNISDGVLIILAIAIYWLSQALRAVAEGDLFSRRVVRRFRLFSLWMLIMALFSTLAPTVVAALGQGYGRHHILLVLDLRDLLLVSLTLLMLLIARMFERARALEDEMSEII